MTCGVEQEHSRHEPDDEAKDAGTEQDDPAVLLQLLLQVVVLSPTGSEFEIAVFVGVHEGQYRQRLAMLCAVFCSDLSQWST